jgi:hypothetical protein
VRARERKDHEKEGARGFSLATVSIESFGQLGKRVAKGVGNDGSQQY